MADSKPLRVVLATVGSRGDVQPMLALAQALRLRGHVPMLAAPPNFEAWVRSLGFDFAPLGVDMQTFLAATPQILTSHPLKMGKLSLAYFRTHAPLQSLQLLSACQGADAVLYGGLSIFYVPSVAQVLGIAAMHVQFTTCLLPAESYPPMAFAWHGLPTWMNRALWWMHLRAGNWAMLPTLNALRAKLSQAHRLTGPSQSESTPLRSLPTLTEAWHHILQDCPLVIAADELLMPADARWQGRYGYANFLFFNDPRRLDADLQDWLNAGQPPVYIGFGSMSGSATKRLESLLLDAFAGTGHRVLIAAGWAGLGADTTLPEGWRVVADAPHALLFKQVAVVVHHGGSGTMAQALRAGVAQVVLPLILDQFHQAHRLYQCGLAQRPLPMEKVTALQLRKAIEAALAMPQEPRQQAAQRLQQTDAARDIAIRLEALLRG